VRGDPKLAGGGRRRQPFAGGAARRGAAPGGVGRRLRAG